MRKKKIREAINLQKKLWKAIHELTDDEFQAMMDSDWFLY